MGAINERQKIELDILAQFSRVCCQKGFTWFAMFGTLLGAVRNGGFIPWDDDIDVAMPREDYDRLRHQACLFHAPYFLQTPGNDPSASPRFMRLMRDDTTVIKQYPNNFIRGGHMGAYIDILPLDGVPDAKQARELHAAVWRIHKQMLASAALDENTAGVLPDWKAASCYGWGGMTGCYPLLAERYEWVCSRYPDGRYYAMPMLYGARGCRVYDRKWFAERETLIFEGMDIPAPCGWREVLAVSYPEGLLEPEEGDRRTDKDTDAAITDMRRSYREYARRYTGMLDGIAGKRLLLFGAGDSLRIWLERYGRGDQVVCSFDNGRAKWGTNAYGVPVRSPEELPSLLGADTRLIIVSIWHREIAKQLMGMGIEDFYIFLDGIHYREGD